MIGCSDGSNPPKSPTKPVLVRWAQAEAVTPLVMGSVKPIFFDYPNDQQSYSINNEWLFGDSLLAAPVLANIRSRRIHVPSGQWYDVRNSCLVSGQTNLRKYPVTLADVPMFRSQGCRASRVA